MAASAMPAGHDPEDAAIPMLGALTARRVRFFAATVCLALAGGGASLLATPALAAAGPRAGAEAQEPAADRTFFGYTPGEERRYRLGPPDSLMPGESAEWSIRFTGFRESEYGPAAEMEFGHRRFELIPGSWNPAEEVMEVRIDGRALLSLDGFPLVVEFEQFFVNQGERLAEDGRRRVVFTYLEDAEEYRKDLKVGGREWDFDFRVATYGEMDLDARRGLFLYLPSALGCLGTSRSICIDEELAFANPGFLGLVVPYLLEEEKAERDFMFFKPESVGASPFRPMVPSEWLSRERSGQRNQRRYFERWKLKLGASEEVEVGPRTMHAWELDMGGGIDRAWVEPGGRVLRVDLETSMHIPDKRYIRLVFPYEDFVTPNEDPAESCCRR